MERQQPCGADPERDRKLACKGLLLRQKYNNVALRLHTRAGGSREKRLKHALLTVDDCATVKVVAAATTTEQIGAAKSEAFQPIAAVPLLSVQFLKNIKEAAPKLSLALTDLSKEVDTNELNAENVDQHLAEVKDPIPIKTKKPYKTVYFNRMDL